jgi:hypothetical protein
MKYVLFSAYYALKAALISEISLRVLRQIKILDLFQAPYRSNKIYILAH